MTDRTAPQTPVVDARNADQASAWNGDEGADWAARPDRYDAASGRFDAHLISGARIAPDEIVLDVGCGAGVSARAAAQVAVAGHVTGIDLSAPLLAEARRRSEAAGLTNTSFVQGDAQIHPFEHEGYDVVISRFGAMFFGDPVAAFTNIARALRPGGRLAMLSWQPLARNDWLLLIRRSLAAGRSLPEPPSGAPGPFGLADPDDVRRILTASGFDAVDVTGVQEPVWLGTDAEDAFGFVSRTGVARGLLGGLDEQARSTAVAALRDQLAAHATPDGVLLGAAGWLITARRR